MAPAYPFDLRAIESPSYVLDEAALRRNLELLRAVAADAGAKILLAQKAFSCYHLYPLIGAYLSGTTASSLHEARLGAEHMPGGETHIYSPAFREDEFDEIVRLCDHLVFNSPAQFRRFAARARALKPALSLGLRVNPECRTQHTTPLYDPCAPHSRLGVTARGFDPALLPELDGLHFHTLCEQNADDLLTTFAAFEQRFGRYLAGLKWLNLGGGHHITREDYRRGELIALVRRIRARYGLEVYLEPGEAVALNAGYLLTEVLDFVENGLRIAILDSSAECHMPDVLAMPYRPPLLHAGAAEEKAHRYRLASATCLAGDVVGDYSFDEPLRVGDRLLFGDMAIYTMVKNNTFNGIGLPSIYLLREDGALKRLKRFGYEDFKARL